jgi:hypothetical protein
MGLRLLAWVSALLVSRLVSVGLTILVNVLIRL